MNRNLVDNVVIIGGGTAGWMTAAALSRFIGRQGGKVVLVESEDIGPIGVGEATIPHIHTFNNRLGIDEDDFIKATQGTFKLGIDFVDWRRKGERYFHPFGTHGFDLEGIDFHHFWRRNALLGDNTPLEQYSINALAAFSGKFVRPEQQHGPVIKGMAYAYHFDSVLYGQFLRTFAQKQGVTRIEGIVTDVSQHAETGFIESVTLKSGQTIAGDLFIDCTGFRGLLIEQTLEAGYDDWSHYLPVDRAVAVPCEKVGDPSPFTRATARKAGWQWRIPLQHRTGNGHVYCSKYISDDEAEAILLDNLDGAPLTSPKRLRFTTGRRRKFWDKNCIAIGLSAGFMEPLESTSIHLIQSGISKLLALFPDKSMNPVERDEYNRLLTDDYAHIRDFLILHYKLTERDDSDFWNYVRTMDIPETLEKKMELLSGSGRFFRYESELFEIASWIAVAVGQGLVPGSYNPITHIFGDENIQKSLANMRDVLAKSVDVLPTHQQFIDRYCKAQDVYLPQADAAE